MRNPLPYDVSSRLQGIRPAGETWSAKCPAHDDSSPSLSITVKDDGKILWHCHAGCDQQAVQDALAITPQQADPHWEERKQSDGNWATSKDRIVAEYDYVDAHGTLLYQVVRKDPKAFLQRHPDPAKPGEWIWGRGEAPLVLYRLPNVIAALNEGQTVWITEGEKDVHTLEVRGIVATCNSGGAGKNKWREEYAAVFPEGSDVVIAADNDTPGQEHARTIAMSLRARGVRTRVVEAKQGKDVSDHFAAGCTLEDLLTTQEPDQANSVDEAVDLWEFLDGEDADYDWVIPGILERKDRLMITGYEGWGKSTLVRQFAMSCAAGVHPFNGDSMTPQKVLFIDCENSVRQLRRGLSRMLPVVTQTYEQPPGKDMMMVLSKMGGVDLTKDEDAQWLMERAVAHKPDVLFVGPLYYLYEEGSSDEAVMRRLQKAIDEVRQRIGCAVVIEAHPGHGSGMGQRSTRVAGSSVWLRWLESGIGIAPFEHTDEKTFSPLEVVNWKKHRFERSWPERIMHGAYDGQAKEWRDWPWVVMPGYHGPDIA